MVFLRRTKRASVIAMLIRQQCGMSLVIVLIWLFVLTLLVLASAQQVLLDHRIASNFHDHVIAFNLAESGLSLAALKIQNKPYANPMNGINFAINYIGKIKTKKIFQAISKAEYHGVHVVLECEYAVENKQIQKNQWQEIF